MSAKPRPVLDAVLAAALVLLIGGVLGFEITETAAVTHLAEATVFLDAMRRHGIRIAQDDFGADVSSCGYLKNFNVDFAQDFLIHQPEPLANVLGVAATR